MMDLSWIEELSPIQMVLYFLIGSEIVNELLSWIEQMLEGCKLTAELFVVTLVFSIPLSLVLCFLRASTSDQPKLNNFFNTYKGHNAKLAFIKVCLLKILNYIISGFILLMRGTPLMLQIFFVYFGLPNIPVIGQYFVLDRFTAGAIAFILNYAAYYAEIFRGGLISVDSGQYEASKVLGLTPMQTKIKIIMPQMFRIALPSVSNETIILLKDTALITAIGLSDLLKVTTSIVNRTTNITAFAVAAAFYLIMSYVLTVIFKKLEDKFSY